MKHILVSSLILAVLSTSAYGQMTFKKVEIRTTFGAASKATKGNSSLRASKSGSQKARVLNTSRFPPMRSPSYSTLAYPGVGSARRYW